MQENVALQNCVNHAINDETTIILPRICQAMPVVDSTRRPVVAFMCVHNCCSRSQMAEGIMRSLKGGAVTVISAGSERGRSVNPSAIAVMKEIGIDISSHVSTLMDDVTEDVIDLAITLCSSNCEICPSFHEKKVATRIDHEFDDPSALEPSGEDGLAEYRRVRDEILQYVQTLYPDLPSAATTPNNEGISFFEKYLSLWVLLCIVTGSLIGYYAPESAEGLKKAEVEKISLPIAVLLWVMIFPMLLQIDFEAVVTVLKNPGPIAMTTGVNFGIQPFTMYGFALLFFRYIYSTIIPTELANEYLAGAILLGGSPCTAMVFVWSVLVGGDAAYTLVQVAVNDLATLALYLPTMMLLLNVSSIPIPYETIAISVCLFIAIPLILSVIVRRYALRKGGKEMLERLIGQFKPVTTAGLLATLVLIFIYQGRNIGNKPLHIVLIAIPLTLQTLFIFALTYWMGFMVCFDPKVVGPSALISTSNFFELAVAIAVSVYGADSGASLATVVGVLVEVPTMLFLVWLCKRMEPMTAEHMRNCHANCKALNEFAQFNCCSNVEQSTSRSTTQKYQEIVAVL